jgi:hypothetical protein
MNQREIKFRVWDGNGWIAGPCGAWAYAFEVAVLLVSLAVLLWLEAAPL